MTSSDISEANKNRVFHAKNMGFCFGVRRAVEITEEALKKGRDVYILGPLIHNPQEVARLSSKGAKIVERPEDIEKGTLVIRSHGVPPKVKEKALKQGINIIDATCPFVRKVQNIASRMVEEGYELLILGDITHPEVKGLLGYAPHATVIASVEDLSKLKRGKPLGLISQTTQKEEIFSELVKHLVPMTFELRVFNTICKATEERQQAVRELAEEVDIIIVAGGKKSSNTNKLASICRDSGVRAYHIETADDLRKEWFSYGKKVGVTAGASTPEWIIEEITRKIEEYVK